LESPYSVFGRDKQLKDTSLSELPNELESSKMNVALLSPQEEKIYNDLNGLNQIMKLVNGYFNSKREDSLFLDKAKVKDN
jgi:hypothetical protein